MPEWIAKYWVEWVFGIIAALLSFGYRNLAKKIKKEADERKALKAGVRSLLRRQIIIDCEAVIQNKCATMSTKDNIHDMYESYHGLGGNGRITRLYNQAMDAPLKNEDVMHE